MNSPLAKLSLSCLVACGVAAATAQNASVITPSASRSHSGQFIVRSDPGAGYSRVASLYGTNVGLVQIDASLLSVSAERIRQALVRQVGDLGPWHGKIQLEVFPALSTNDPVFVMSELFSDGWLYRVQLPNPVLKQRFVSALVQAVLTEFANRHPGQKAAEIPLWLAEGLTAQLMASRDIELVLASPSDLRTGMPMTSMQRQARRDNPLAQAHQFFQKQNPLSFEQLSWPDTATAENPGEAYVHSSQLFITRLLSMDQGAARMRSTVALLPQYQNWQFAFLRAFNFSRSLDVEKWWTLQISHFISRTAESIWDLETSRAKLDVALLTDVQVRTSTNDLPALSQVDFQTVLKDMNPAEALELFQRKIIELQMLQIRMAPELRGITQNYIIGLDIMARELAANPEPPARLIERAVKTFDDLDRAKTEGRIVTEKHLAPAGQRPAGLSPDGLNPIRNNYLRPGV